MSDLRAAAQQALEALEFLSLDFFMLDPISPGREAGNKAMVALRAALAEPKEKPWRCACGANLYIDENGAPRSKA